MRLAVFTTLYPSAPRPRHGIFVEQRIRRLVESGLSAAAVVPVPRCPPFDWFLAEYREQRKAPAAEIRHGVSVRYPRFPTWPLIGRLLNPLLMALGARKALAKVIGQSDEPVVIDAHFFFPDGIAAAILGAWLGRPVVITARGSDVNVLARSAIARAWMRWASSRAFAIIAVSDALKRAMVELGLDASRISVLRNGVDTSVFGGHERATVRRELGLDGLVLLSVGNLVREKGHHQAIEALAAFPAARLILIGRGPEAQALRRQAADLGVAERVTFIEVLAQPELARYYAAANVTILMSAREGLPNVLLESMACGTPVVATNVGGVAEVVTAPQAGLVLEAATTQALVAALRQLLAAPPSPASTAEFARRFDWRPTTEALQTIYSEALAAAGSPGAAAARS